MESVINKNGHPRILDYILWDGITPIHSINFITTPNPPLLQSDEDAYNIRGVKVKSDLLGTYDNKLCVRRNFIEDYENRILKIHFEWFNDDGSINCVKDKIVRLSNAQWESRFRKQRERIIDDLKGRAKKYDADTYIDILYKFFKDEKEDFIETGSLIFSNKVYYIHSNSIENILSENDNYNTSELTIVKSILNTSLDGIEKVYETLMNLTNIK